MVGIVNTGRSLPKMKKPAVAPMIRLIWMPELRPRSATSANSAGHSVATITSPAAYRPSR